MTYSTLRPGKPLRRSSKPINRRGKRSKTKQARLAPVRPELAARSGGRCEFPGCNNRADDPHHRMETSQGGPDTLVNLRHVCRECHGWIHGHPRWSYYRGWMIRSWDGKRWGVERTSKLSKEFQ